MEYFLNQNFFLRNQPRDVIFYFYIAVIATIMTFIGWQLAMAMLHAAQAMMPVLDHADRQLMLVMNFTGSHAMDNFWYKYSQRVIWLPLIIAVVATIITLHPGSWREKVVFVIAVAAIILVTDQLASGIIKPLAGRLRPSHTPALAPLLHYVNGYHGGLYGFVSNHAAVNVGIATMLCTIFHDRFTRFTLVLYAALMCYSRIYLGVHYPGDVLCGALLGWAIVYMAFKWFGNRINVFTTDRRPTLFLLVFYATLTIIITSSAC